MNIGNDDTKERGWILRILDRMYPDYLDRETLKKQLTELKFLTGEKDIRANIAYLEEKGLVKAEEVGTGIIKRTVVRLTTKGKDAVDGIGEDVTGVEL